MSDARRRNRELLAAHVILVLLGVLVILVATFQLSNAWQQAFYAVGTTMLATPVVSGLLRAFSGDPIEDLREALGSMSRVIAEAQAAGLTGVQAERGKIPTSHFTARATGSSERIWVLAYAAEFLADDPAFFRTLGEKSRAGCDVRVLMGDPGGQHILSRDEEEAHEGSIPSRIETTISRAAREMGSEWSDVLRIFDAPLYASIYRFDNAALVCPALFAQRGSRAPAFEIEAGKSLFHSYERHFEDVWTTSRHIRPDGRDASGWGTADRSTP